MDGKENVVVDTLSHRRHVTLSMTLSVDLRSHILQALPTNIWYQEVSRKIASRRPLEGRFLDYVLKPFTTFRKDLCSANG